MCCFSVASPAGWIARLVQAVTPPVHVSATNIFARMVAPGEQVLVYSMNIATKQPVAMILPLPIAHGADEHALRFVSLEKHPRMFVSLGGLFEFAQTAARKGGLRLPMPSPRQKLVVHEVGAFIASFVPSRADFDRLDERFRMPSVLFDAVPAYADYGFAVFQLQPGRTTVHPMAMRFPTRAPDQLFFPTVHVHDGRWKPTARFDHALYYQTPRRTKGGEYIPSGVFEGDEVGWILPSADFEGMVTPGAAMLRRRLRKRRANEDTWIAA